MENDKPKILVIGAGVNGSVCAARLHAGGVDVTVLARPQRLAVLERDGIVIENPFNQRRTVAKVPLIGELAPADRYDYILVVVRRSQVSDLLATLAANCSPNVVFMSNNLLGPAEIIQAMGRERVMLGFVFAGGKRDGEIIRAFSAPKRSPMGAPFGELDGSVTPRLKRLVSTLRRGGLPARISTNIVDWLATHAAGVAAMAPMALRYHADLRALARSRDDLRLMIAAMHEALSVIKAQGHKIVPSSQKLLLILPAFVPELLSRWLFSSKLGEFGASWHVQQAPDEMQALAGDLRQMVLASSLPVPALRKVLELPS
jgi:2-dehydropantoate 2-reductase